MSWKGHLALCGVGLALVAAQTRLTDWDLRIEDRFYDFQAKQWLVEKDQAPVLHAALYTGLKVVTIVLGAGCAAVAVLSIWRRRLARFRIPALRIALATALVPLLVAVLKETTNVHMPDQIVRYGGTHPYVHVFAPHPPGCDERGRGKGFPAGHSTAGFALLALAGAFRRWRGKLLGIGIGLADGWIAGLYQMARGKHYLSHTLTTMFLAWAVVALIGALLPDPARPQEPSPPKNSASLAR